MTILLIILVLFSSCLFFVALLQLIFLTDKRLQKRLKHYLQMGHEGKKLDRNKFNILVQFRLANQQLKNKLLTKKSSSKLEVKLKRAGVPLKPEEYMLFQFISTMLAGMLLYIFSGKIFFLLFGFVVGYYIPRMWLRKKQQQRINKFNNTLPDMITTIVGSLRAGFSFPQALKTVVEEADSPMKEEMGMVLKEMQYGNSIEEALDSLKERMPSEDLELMIEAILIQRQVGGNLATVLDKIVETIRDRMRIQRQILTLTAQGRLSGTVIGLLPVILAIVIYFIEPDYISTLFTHPVGLIMLAIGLFAGIIGFILIRKLTVIEV